jgi:hypothetical protein
MLIVKAVPFRAEKPVGLGLRWETWNRTRSTPSENVQPACRVRDARAVGDHFTKTSQSLDISASKTTLRCRYCLRPLVGTTGVKHVGQLESH